MYRLFIPFPTEANNVEFISHKRWITLDNLHLWMSLQTFGPLICFEENRKQLRLLFTSGLMSTLLKLLSLLVMSQTRLVKKVEVSPLREGCFLSSNQIKGNFRVLLKSEIPVNVIKMCTCGGGDFRSLNKPSEMSSQLIKVIKLGHRSLSTWVIYVASRSYWSFGYWEQMFNIRFWEIVFIPISWYFNLNNTIKSFIGFHIWECNNCNR